MRKVWYHQIWIQNDFGFIVLILIFIFILSHNTNLSIKIIREFSLFLWLSTFSDLSTLQGFVKRKPIPKMKFVINRSKDAIHSIWFPFLEPFDQWIRSQKSAHSTHSILVDYLAPVMNTKNCPTTFYCIFQLVRVPMTTMQNIRVCFLSSNNTFFFIRVPPLKREILN